MTPCASTGSATEAVTAAPVGVLYSLGLELKETPVPGLPAADPAELGFDADRLARIGPAMQRYIDDGKVPNLLTLVARHGKVAWFDARGRLDVDEHAPADENTLFRMYSNTKPIAGTAIMVLFEEGKLTPDDSIGRYLPAYKKLRVQTADPAVTEKAHRGITIRDCLTNTTGLATPASAPLAWRQQYSDVFETLGWTGRGDTGGATVRQRVDAYAKLPLSHQPGTYFGYHMGYMAVGAVIEEVTGQSLESFFRERIFDPLKMDATGFFVRDGQEANLGSCYAPSEIDGEMRLNRVETGPDSEKVKGPKNFFAAGGDRGGVVSTIGDYTRFGQMLLNGGELDGARIIGRKAVEYMTSNHTPGLDIPMTGPGFGWGLGVSVHTGDGGFPLLRSVGSYGWGGAAGTTYFGDPKEGIVAACFTQLLMAGAMPYNDYQGEFQRLVYHALN
ncbi:MAG: hypothetical protein CMQ24_14320 [Gammaproteobacteria bacterium]|nr:hypothetical protein [Gammaproteobacteria bacterium]